MLTYNNVNYCAWHVYKSLFDCSVASCRLAYIEIYIVTALAQLYALDSHRARSFSQ